MNIIETNWKWNGELTSRSATDYIALHNAEAVKCTAEQVDSWHKANGWAGIGYHFFVRKNGEIYPSARHPSTTSKAQTNITFLSLPLSYTVNASK